MGLLGAEARGRSESGHSALLVVNGLAGPRSDNADRIGSRLARWIAKRRAAGHALYSRLDRIGFPVEDDPLAREDLSALVQHVPRLIVVGRRTAHSDYLADDDVERILGADLDVALRLGFRILRGRALSIARLGVWSYHHGDNRVNRGGPPGFWEVAQGNATTGAVVAAARRVTRRRSRARAYLVHTQMFSVNRNRAHLYWHAAPLLERALRDIGRSSTPPQCRAADTRLLAYNHRLFVAPTNAQVLRAAGRLASRGARRFVQRYLRDEQWCVACHCAPNDGTPDLTPYRFHTLVPPNDRFWADPFPAHDRGRDWVFIEEFIDRVGRGRISVLELDAKGIVGNGAPTPVLEPPHHLSYPFIFRHNDTWYLMPESRERKQVEVYRASSFPFQWTLDRAMLVGIDAIDPTHAYIDGRWWLFANVAEEHRSSWIELHAFYSDTPFGPWVPHRRNPIVSDVRSARPAGKLFSRNGVWYRPAHSSYGAAVNIQRIDRLDPDEYVESHVTRLEASWRPNLVGVHTINASETLTVIDVRRRRWRWQR